MALINIPVPGLRGTVGLGQAIKRGTAALGIRPCGGCKRRAARLDGLVELQPRQSPLVYVVGKGWVHK